MATEAAWLNGTNLLERVAAAAVRVIRSGDRVHPIDKEEETDE